MSQRLSRPFLTLETLLSTLGVFASVAISGLGAVWGHNHGLTPLFFAGVAGMTLSLGPLAFAAGRRTWPRGALRVALALSGMLAVFLGFESLLALQRPGAEDRNLSPITTYDGARADPGGFRRWWSFHIESFLRLPIFRPDSRGKNPFELVPGATANYHDSSIRINALGFRGDELSDAAEGKYRIVALGESTTFGITILSEYRPWPDLLEDRINERFACARPVEVINAGVPGWTLANQLGRLDDVILPLQPDLLLSYHGYNGFHFFFQNLPEMVVDEADLPRERPSRLLSLAERSYRVWRLRQRFAAAGRAGEHPPNEFTSPDALSDSVYAELYEQLVARAQQRGIPVALASFNMAIDPDSPEAAVRFYESLFPDARVRMHANAFHNRLVREIARQRGALFVEATTGLGGTYRDHYTDIVHLNQPGRERLADNFLLGLTDLLQQAPQLRCRPQS
jgi:lysophospholipase L1-like esterase